MSSNRRHVEQLSASSQNWTSLGISRRQFCTTLRCPAIGLPLLVKTIPWHKLSKHLLNCARTQRSCGTLYIFDYIYWQMPYVHSHESVYLHEPAWCHFSVRYSVIRNKVRGLGGISWKILAQVLIHNFIWISLSIHWGQDETNNISYMTFSNVFVKWKCLIFD